LALKLLLITGESGSGKTTFCTAMVQMARESGWDAAGLLSLAEFEGSVKRRIRVEDLRSGETRLMASDQRQTENDLVFGKWFFVRKTLIWGNDVLRASIPCDLLVVDELGPLELRLSQGWMSALEVIRSDKYKLALVVIRPELVKTAHAIFHPVQTIQINNVEEVREKSIQCFFIFGRDLK
jgi:nucleoside-triphosphatase